jgi:S1-C subfamily serine protease
MKLLNLVTVTLIAVGCLGPSDSAAIDPEPSVFDAADGYTVRIRTLIEYGLGDDAIGFSKGTGFVVDAERGWIITNRHVVGESPSEVEISRKGQRFQTAHKVYIDPYIDIAIVSTGEPISASEATLGCGSALPNKGHSVGAYGHPWDLEYTGTQGVISGYTHKYGPELLQTDAPINPGNSGGPLISLLTGEVVGVNAAKISEEGVENLGFAVPIKQVCRILDLLKAGEDPSPPNLGATFFDLEDSNAIIVSEVFDAAFKLGLRQNDEIVAAGLALEPVDGYHELIDSLRGSLDSVLIRVFRNGEFIELDGSLPPWKTRRGVAFAGLVFAPFNFRDFASLPISHDIGIQNVVSGSFGDGVDIRFWDMIRRVNDVEIQGLEHLYAVLSSIEEGALVTLDMLRPLEDMHFFVPIRRTIRSESPVWLDNGGETSGIEALLTWAEDELKMPSTSASATKRHLINTLSEIRDLSIHMTDAKRAQFENRALSLLQNAEFVAEGQDTGIGADAKATSNAQ